MVAGCHTVTLNQGACDRAYWVLKNTQLYWMYQNTWSYPTAYDYVQRLFQEAPKAKQQPLKGHLAVLTHVSPKSSAYYVAEELALSVGMDLILLGSSHKKLKQVEHDVRLEARQRSNAAGISGRVQHPKVFKVRYDSDDLASVMRAAKEVQRIANNEERKKTEDDDNGNNADGKHENDKDWEADKNATNNGDNKSKTPIHEYHGQIQILMHNSSGVTVGSHAVTNQGIEMNVGRNHVAPYLLTEFLLPLLKKGAQASIEQHEKDEQELAAAEAAANEPNNKPPTKKSSHKPTPLKYAFKPRVIFATSVGHCQGTDWDPARFVEHPDEGGAPEGTLVPASEAPDHDEEEGDSKDRKVYVGGLDASVAMYFRAKMAVMANAIALSQQQPNLAFLTVYPGSVAAKPKKHNSQGIAGTIYQKSFWFVNISPTQGSRAALRAALDPDVNKYASLYAGGYLHCDGNPWRMAQPTCEITPGSGQVYSEGEYAQKVRECTQALIDTLMPAIEEAKLNKTMAPVTDVAVAGEAPELNLADGDEPGRKGDSVAAEESITVAASKQTDEKVEEEVVVALEVVSVQEEAAFAP